MNVIKFSVRCKEFQLSANCASAFLPAAVAGQQSELVSDMSGVWLVASALCLSLELHT